MRLLRTLLFVICAALVTSSVHAQNSGTIPINVQQDKLEKQIVGTAIIGMRDRAGKVVATFHFQTNQTKCPMFRIGGFDFVMMSKLDNAQVDSVDTAFFPSLEQVLRQRENRRPDYTVFNSRLDRIQIGPQTMFEGKINTEDAQEGDNAIFSHAVTRHKQRVMIFWIIDASKDRRNWLQDSLPVVIRDCGRGQEQSALTDMARAGWEFTSMADQQMFKTAAMASQMPGGFGVTQDQGQNDHQFDPGQGQRRDEQGYSGRTDVNLQDLDAKPTTFRLNGQNVIGTTKFDATSEQKPVLEIENSTAFRVVFVKVYEDGKEKSFYDKTFSAKARLPLDFKAGAKYRIEVRDPATNKLMATVRLEAK